MQRFLEIAGTSSRRKIYYVYGIIFTSTKLKYHQRWFDSFIFISILEIFESWLFSIEVTRFHATGQFPILTEWKYEFDIASYRQHSCRYGIARLSISEVWNWLGGRDQNLSNLGRCLLRPARPQNPTLRYNTVYRIHYTYLLCSIHNRVLPQTKISRIYPRFRKYNIRDSSIWGGVNC